MTREAFDILVKIEPINYSKRFRAKLDLYGREYSCEGDSIHAATENLWEYLVSDIGVI